MNDIVPFIYEPLDLSVRTIVKDGKPWFIAKDICDILGLTHITNALATVPGKHKLTVTLLQSGQRRDMVGISEPGLYRMTLRSNKPEAQPFIDWVTEEVLPSIRKTGSYTPQSFADALQLAADQQRAIEEKQARLEVVEPVYEAVAETSHMLMRDWIKLMKSGNGAVKERAVHHYLIDNGYLYRDANSRLQARAECDHLFVEKLTLGNDRRYHPTLHITGEGIAALSDEVVEYFS